MELTVSNPTLHPIWAKALGLRATSSAPPESAIASVIAPDTSDGWQVIQAVNPRSGAPIAVKKKLGPNLWVSTTVRPGDPRYPAALQA